MSNDHLRQLGWYLRNVVAASIRPELNHLVALFLDGEPGFTALRKRGDTDPELPAGHDAAASRRILLRRLARFSHPPEGDEAHERNARFAAEEFGLEPLDLALLLLTLRRSALPQLGSLYGKLRQYVGNTRQALAVLLGVEPQTVNRRLAASAPLQGCGLLTCENEWERDGEVELAHAFRIVMREAHADRKAWLAAMVGERCDPGLAWDEFAHLGAVATTASCMLREAAAHAEAGVHVLLVGPPGTGKTEFARALATHAGLALYAAGEEDGEEEEPSRQERLSALRVCHTLLRNRRDAAALLDEAEDVLESAHSFKENRGTISKMFLNRMLERSPVPTIWTANDIGWMDRAVLRRMTLVMRLDVPDAAVRERIWRRVLDREGLALADSVASRLALRWPSSAGVAVGAARATRLAGGGEEALELAVAGVARAVGNVPEPDVPIAAAVFDPALTACREDLDALCRRLARPGAPRGWSLCLSGPPGTGKSEFARYLAGRLDLPVLQKRASDLLSMWVGGSEQAIAAAFAEAVEKKALLLIDEAEALLFDRNAAERAFEVSQVNEMLTWMERHPMPFVCTTNLPERLDGAVPRRFTLKLRFEALDPRRAALAFGRILGALPPGNLPDGLTPGDFATVRRKAELFEEARPAVLLDWLAEEAAAKQGDRRPIGFRTAVQVPEPMRSDRAA